MYSFIASAVHTIVRFDTVGCTVTCSNDAMAHPTSNISPPTFDDIIIDYHFATASLEYKALKSLENNNHLTLHVMFTALVCEPPSNVPQASLNFGPTTFGALASYSCGVGYRFTRTMPAINATCGPRGRWIPEPRTLSCTGTNTSQHVLIHLQCRYFTTS